LSAGAKELYTFLVARAGKLGYCRWSQLSIARDFRKSVRTIGRRVSELVSAGLVLVTRRGSKTNLYSLPESLPQQLKMLWKTPVNSDENGRSDRSNLSDREGPYLISEKDAPEKDTQSECVGVEPAAATSSATDSSNEYKKAQRAAVERTVRAAGIEPTDELIGKLARKAAFYRANGFQVAAAIDRCLDRVKNAPSNAPRSEAWVLKCVENEFYFQWGDPRARLHERLDPDPVADVSAEVRKCRTASGWHEHGAQREAATGVEQPDETLCRPLARPGHGARRDSATPLPEGHETNPGWLLPDRAPPAPAEWLKSLNQLAREKSFARTRAG